MRHLLVFFIVLSYINVYGQTDVKTVFENAKNEFKRIDTLDRDEYDKINYTSILKSFKESIKLEPDNAEALYFLGYVYSRMNSKDGRKIIDLSVDLTIKSSEQFEKINEITPKYSGELLFLDPYSKISAEWGSLGLKYLYEQKKDSAIWAFKEGKRRGGFSKYALKTHRKVLEACSENSVLISSGDMSTFPLYYLQTVENFRNDISLVDVTLLNTVWYPNFLSVNNIIAFDIPKKELETIDYLEWPDKLIKISDFSWMLKASYEGHLLRGDRVFLSFLKQNKFKRDIYFTLGFDRSSELSLRDYLGSKIVVNQLVYSELENEDFDQYKKSISRTLKLTKYIDLNNPDELAQLEFYRYNLLNQISYLLDENDKKRAKQLISILDKYAPENIYPYKYTEDSESLEKYRNRL
ncbi:hypothetical protein [Winogradskyella sp. PE311]|uniref:hypothetical protein n=1 Tax=Winogradskyella sp. PE311 TaxID=3366943 RepID=UPI00397F4D62